MEAVVIGPGGGEQVSERVRILADLDQIAITESVYAPGDSGPGPHIHDRHFDTFYVLGGGLAFELGREAQRFEAPAGTFIGAPPGVVHTFRNEGPQDARFLNFHAPGSGFGSYLRDLVAERDTSWFDAAGPPEDGGPPASAALYVPTGEGARDDGHAGAAFVWKARSDELALSEQLVEPGFPGQPPHQHETFVDAIYLLEGTLSVRAGAETVDVGPGTFALVPPGVVHTFSNPGPGQARVLGIMAPAREAARAIRAEYDFVRA